MAAQPLNTIRALPVYTLFEDEKIELSDKQFLKNKMALRKTAAGIELITYFEFTFLN